MYFRFCECLPIIGQGKVMPTGVIQSDSWGAAMGMEAKSDVYNCLIIIIIIIIIIITIIINNVIWKKQGS